MLTVTDKGKLTEGRKMDLQKLLSNFANLRTSGPTLLAAVNVYLSEVGVNPLPDWASWIITGAAVVYLTFFVKAEKK